MSGPSNAVGADLQRELAELLVDEPVGRPSEQVLGDSWQSLACSMPMQTATQSPRPTERSIHSE